MNAFGNTLRDSLFNVFGGRARSRASAQALQTIRHAMLNLLPLPMLDGGHLMYYIFEALTGRPVSETWLARRQKRYPAEQQRILLLTDGRLKSMPEVPAFACPSLLVDIERGPIRLGRSKVLAQQLQAEYRHIDD